MRKLLDKVTAFIEKHQLMNPDKLYLVALSGGRDSVALLLMLRELGYRIEAVHCNFMLRGEESMRDEQFCRDLCLRFNVPFHTVHFDTRAYSALHQVSIEMAARDLRYAHFKKLCGDIHAAGVCVAHHMDASVGTILLNLLRGTGIHAWSGVCRRQYQFRSRCEPQPSSLIRFSPFAGDQSRIRRKHLPLCRVSKRGGTGVRWYYRQAVRRSETTCYG